MSLPLTLLVFFASGCAALLYQVIWQRMLAIFSGADVYPATVIVAAFMGGLGVGHLAGGHVADRVSRRASLLLFGAAEAAIAAFGLFSATLYYDVLYQRLGATDLGRGAVAMVPFGSLLWPTFLMGASLPLLARAMTDHIDRAASSVGALYGFNTLGAAIGAVVGTWALLPALGLDGSLVVAATLNAASAAVVVPVAWRMGSDPGDGAYQPLESVRHRGLTPFWRWAAVYGFSGFVAKSTAFTFGTLLTLYLAGIGLGAVVGSGRARRARRPARAFFLLQAAAGLSAGLLLAIFVLVADDSRALRGYFAGYEPLNVRKSVHALRVLAGNALPGPDGPVEIPANFLRLYVVVPLLLVVPPTFLMGCAFPFLQRVVQTDTRQVGRRVGALLLANIVGSLLGTVLTGWLLLGALGTALTLKLLAAMSGVFLALAMLAGRGAGTGAAPAGAVVRAVGAAAAATLAVVAVMPDGDGLWARLHGTAPERAIVGEDNSGVSVIQAGEDGFDGRTVVFVNGVGQSVIPYGDIHTVLGALPALVHPDPREVAVIGLGSGDTVYAAASRPGTTRITCIEIIAPQLAPLRALARRGSYGGLRALLADPRIEHVAGDGRAYLMRTARRFDIIEADALRPTSAYSGHLYSDAYFTLVRSRLKPHGLAATWAPTTRVHDTFVRVFPYVISAPGILLGSSEPFEIDRAALGARLADPHVRAHYARAEVDIDALLRPYLEGSSARLGPEFDRVALVDLNTDLFPKDEFDLSPP